MRGDATDSYERGGVSQHVGAKTQNSSRTISAIPGARDSETPVLQTGGLLAAMLTGSGPRFRSVTLPSLPIALGLILGALLTVFNAFNWFEVSARNPIGNDFHLYYAAAFVARTQGIAAAYRDATLSPVLAAMGANPHEAFLNPPLLLTIVMPLTYLPFGTAHALWSGLTVVAAVATWALAAPGRGWARAMWLFLFLGWWPIGFALLLGQATLLALLACAGAFRLLRWDHPVAAGIVLSLGAVKPQLWAVAILTLMISWRWRTVAACLTGLVLLGAASFATLGLDGAAAWWTRLHETSNLDFVQRTTALHLLPAELRLGFQVLVLATAMVAAGMHRNIPGVPFAAGLSASILASSYLNQEDLSVLIVAGWLALPARWPTGVAFGMLYVSAEAINLAPPVPLAISEVLFLATLVARAVRR